MNVHQKKYEVTESKKRTKGELKEEQTRNEKDLSNHFVISGK